MNALVNTNNPTGGVSDWWSGLDVWVKIGVLILLGMSILLVLNFFSLWLNGVMFESERKHKIEEAKLELHVATLKAQTAELEAKAFKAKQKTVSVATELPVSSPAKTFDCENSHALSRNFAKYSNEPQTIEQGKVLPFVHGCSWVRFDYPVTHLTGDNYQIAFERQNDDRSFEVCGRNKINNDVSGKCIALVNGNLGKKFRIILAESGYLNIGGAL